jgi:flagellar hook assembly protein FlgD
MGSTILVRALPNPSSAQTVIRFEARGDGLIEAGVYDPAGRMVRRLSNAILPAGAHDLAWGGRTDDGRIVAAGVYLIRVSHAGEATIARVLIVR